MATKKLSGSEKFVRFVNRSIGKNLTTGQISSRTGVNVRSVQQYCKKLRSGGDVISERQGAGIVYRFTTPIGEDQI